MGMEVKQIIDPAQTELRSFLLEFWSRAPLYFSGFLLIIVFSGLAFGATKLTRLVGRHFFANNLLVAVFSKLCGIIVFILGIYLGLRISGLSQLAATILGGTGIAGLIFGFAFRDIAENFLASILLSVHRPFEIGDIVEIEGVLGVVERMTIRCTVLMNFDGDHIQVPNGTVFKAKIRNLTANSNQRNSFKVGVGFDTSLPQVQEIIRRVLEQHPSVLDDPAPAVLVEELGSATVSIRVYFWVNIVENDSFRIKSSLIRLTKAALEKHGIPMPDEAREIIFPKGVPVVMEESEEKRQSGGQDYKQKGDQLREENSSEKILAEPTLTEAEGNPQGANLDVRKQLANSRPPETGENIL